MNEKDLLYQAHLNGAICLNENYTLEMMQKADDFFRKLNLSYSVWVRDKIDNTLEKYS